MLGPDEPKDLDFEVDEFVPPLFPMGDVRFRRGDSESRHLVFATDAQLKHLADAKTCGEHCTGSSPRRPADGGTDGDSVEAAIRTHGAGLQLEYYENAGAYEFMRQFMHFLPAEHLRDRTAITGTLERTGIWAAVD
uniref:Uncharacterized protein n=1 Tax=Branchiostoma floridae TaxID=7739 RepID=C3XUS8_BRAFL|eukprot:XP_002612144.1 hypothetical protein BRAFLDRAFT_88883 [Branchiostoma floridae]